MHKEELEMIRVTRSEYGQLAHAISTTPLAKNLVMTNGRRIGWQSNRFCYANPIAYKVATGKYPKWFNNKCSY